MDDLIVICYFCRLLAGIITPCKIEVKGGSVENSVENVDKSPFSARKFPVENVKTLFLAF